MKKLKFRGIVAVTALSIFLTGCQTKQTIETTKKEPNSSIIETIEQPSQVETTIVDNQEETKISEIIPENNQTIDNFTFFKDAKQEMIAYIESEEFETLKEKGKYYVTTGIDFIFFNQPINGIYFEQMTTELKKDIIRDVKSLDEAIMAYYPDYKEDISNKYQIASEFISEKYLDIMDSIKEYLGEENYNTVGEIKDQVKEDISKKTEEGIEYIKDLYNSWKINR